jgi:hypothetical protein
MTGSAIQGVTVEIYVQTQAQRADRVSKLLFPKEGENIMKESVSNLRNVVFYLNEAAMHYEAQTAPAVNFI